MSRAANLSSNTNHIERAAGKGEAGKDGPPASAVRLETREGHGDVDLSALIKTMCHLRNTPLLPLHPTATTWGPGRHDVLHFLPLYYTT